MDLTTSTVWYSVALFCISAVVIKLASGRSTFDPAAARPPPPAVKGTALIGVFRTLWTTDPEATMSYLYNKFGSVFTVCFLWKRLTFLVGPEVSGPFFQGQESEVTQGNITEYTVPMFGQEVGFGLEYASRVEQTRFFHDALKPSQLRNHVDPMLREVEEFFANWGEEGVVDLKHEFEQILLLISGRCLLGKEVREKILDEFYELFSEIEKGVNFASFMFPYLPIPVNRRRDRARVKLTGILADIVRSRKSNNRVEEDVLQRLIDSRYKDGRHTTDTEVAGMAIALIFAGQHTSASVTTWTGACLLTHPNFLGAAIEEQNQIMKKYHGKIDYSILLEMETLHSCIKESTRMHASAPVLVRKAQKNITVTTREGTEYGIPKGDTLVNLVMQTSKLPYIYKDPEVYDPDRFRPGREEDKVGGKFSYTFFGGGRHACTGEAYSLMQIKIIWSHLLRYFELELVSPFPKTDWTKFVLEPKGRVMASYKRRPNIY